MVSIYDKTVYKGMLVNINDLGNRMYFRKDLQTGMILTLEEVLGLDRVGDTLYWPHRPIFYINACLIKLEGKKRELLS